MPSILNLKFKGNKSFVAFSNLSDTESLTKTWKVCTKVASYLEQGQRLENLSWRLWHLQNLMVDTDNARSKREFRKLSKCMGDKLDKEKGRNIAELEAPDFRRNHSTDMIQQRAVEKERNREASLNTKPGLIKRMQFTFSVDQPTPAANSDPVKKPDLKPSPEFTKRSRQSQRAHAAAAHDSMVTDDGGTNKDPPSQPTNETATTIPSQPSPSYPTLRFPSIFSNDFGPAALLGSAPTLSASMNYGEGVSSLSNEFSIVRPTIELPLDELMTNVDSADSPGDWTMSYQHNLNIDYNKSSPESSHDSPDFSCYTNQQYQQPDNVIQNVSVSAPVPMKVSHSSTTSGNDSDNEESSESDEEDSEYEAKPTVVQQVAARASGTTPRRSRQLPARTRAGRSNTPRPTLSVRTQNTRSSGPSATATTALSTTTRSNTNTTQTNSAPGGVKAECHNCGATHTPLWRRGLNDELNCNACGLYCKLHKRPRPKTMRSSHGGGGGGGGGGTTTEGRAQAAPRQEIPDVMAAQCYNCHTTATPLWRKDDEGKTVCNACGLYYKLHGSARPISMKSDVIRKRSRHDARRVGGGNNATDTPSASPGVSRRPSPSRESSPTFAPDSTTQMSYDYDLNEFRSTQSELMGALGSDGGNYASQSLYHQLQFPGPYHPDLITAYYPTPADALPFASMSSIDSSSDLENSLMSPRSNKRRRMSNDSASEPPSSAVSYSSYNSGYSTSASSASHSQRSSIDFPFSNYPLSGFNGPALRASSNAFWHPPMMPQPTNTSSPQVIHPPMLPPTNTEDSPMDFLHHPHDDDTLFSTYIHPPMSIPEGENSSGGGGGSHPPMFPNDFSMGDPFENSIRGF